MGNISAYLFGDNNPVILNFRVWYVVEMNFVSRGLEFHEQLKRSSFIVNTDDYGNMYSTLSHETKQKSWQGGIDKTDASKEKECTCENFSLIRYKRVKMYDFYTLGLQNYFLISVISLYVTAL